MTEKNFSCKVVLLGDGTVGKTSLRKTYLGEGFQQIYSLTIGADFAAKRVEIDNVRISANIWDLAGQDRFVQLRQTYYRGSSGAMLVFDVARRESFEKLDLWIKELKHNTKGSEIPMILIGNKSDLRKTTPIEKQVSREEAEEYAKKLNGGAGSVVYIETSALTGDKVETAFHALIEKIYRINS